MSLFYKAILVKDSLLQVMISSIQYTENDRDSGSQNSKIAHNEDYAVLFNFLTKLSAFHFSH